jgi:hypothetical protein
MTTALCLNCGELKWGALCPCKKCNIRTTDIRFSDHYLKRDVLQQLGNVLRLIDQKDVPREIKERVFLYFVSIKIPELVCVQIEDDLKQQVVDIYNQMDLPDIIIK